MVFSPPEYCRLFAQKKAYQGGSRALQDPPSYAPEVVMLLKCHGLIFFICMIHILPSPSVTDSKYLILYMLKYYLVASVQEGV